MRLILSLSVVLTAAFLSGCPADSAVDNNPPQITLDVESQITHVVGDGIIRITAAASDPDGDPVELSVAEQPDRSTFQDTGKLAVFTWDPIVSDVTPSDAPPRKLVFIAKDSNDAITEKTVRVEILPGNGVPRFLEPSPIVLHRIDQSDTVTFDVEVRDDDSAEVQISMDDSGAPAGSVFSQNSSLGGLFRWPVPEEAKERRIHPVVFRVTDGQNPEQELKVSVILEKGNRRSNITKPDPTDPTGCLAEDTIQHVPLAHQAGSEDYAVSVVVEEPWDQVTMYWSDQDVWNDYSLTMESKAMEQEGRVFTATIPNPLLADGESRVYSYQFCAVDNDAAGDEGVICGPSHLFYSFVAYSPGTETCIDDPGPPYDTFDGSVILFPADDAIFSNHRLCSGTPDYFELAVERNQKLSIYVLGTNFDVEQYDKDRNLESSNTRNCPGLYFYEFENNTSSAESRFLRMTGDEANYQVIPFFEDLDSCTRAGEPNDVTGDATAVAIGNQAGQICPMGDVDLYAISAMAGQVLTIDATFTHADGDIDIELWPPSEAATVGDDFTSVDFSVSITDNEQIVHTAQETGTYYLRVLTDDNKSTDYNLTVDISEQQCVDSDAFMGNHDQATPGIVTIASYEDLQLCPQSSDWYEITTLPGDDITFEVSRADGGDIFAIDMNLWLGNAFVDFGINSDGKVVIQRQFSTVETYQLEVVSDEPTTYDLSLSLLF